MTANSGSVANGGPDERGSRPRVRTAASVVVPFPRPQPGDRLDLQRLVPQGRSIAIAFLILAAGLAAYTIACQSWIFAVDDVEVSSATPGVTRQVERALAPLAAGRSLLRVDFAEAEVVLEALPTVRAVSFDRAYPHTLRVVVVPERPVAVVRQGSSSWVVSARGRVMATLRDGARPRLPRIWVTKDVRMQVGDIVSGDLRTAIATVVPLRSVGFPGRVATVASTRAGLVLRLRSGLGVRLGEPTDVHLKLAVAARILPLLEAGTLYLDVSVPERPVSGTTLNSQVES